MKILSFQEEFHSLSKKRHFIKVEGKGDNKSLSNSHSYCHHHLEFHLSLYMSLKLFNFDFLHARPLQLFFTSVSQFFSAYFVSNENLKSKKLQQRLYTRCQGVFEDWKIIFFLFTSKKEKQWETWKAPRNFSYKFWQDYECHSVVGGVRFHAISYASRSRAMLSNSRRISNSFIQCFEIFHVIFI